MKDIQSCNELVRALEGSPPSSLDAALPGLIWAQAPPPLGPAQGVSMLWAILAALAILFLLLGTISLVYHLARRLRKMRIQHPKTVMPDIWFLNPPPPRKRPSERDRE